jgi:ubiquitin C-terminal hydrolase
LIHDDKPFDLDQRIYGDCDSYITKQDFRRKLLIREVLFQLPNSLVVHLCCFNKANRKINIHPTFSSTSYLVTFDGFVGVYSLMAVIFHQGTTYSGHYITIAKRDKECYLFNDLEVTKVTEEELLDFGRIEITPETAWTPYLFFYEQI